MAHKHLTYLDIPMARRRATASEAAARLKKSLGDPSLSTEQVDAVKDRLDRINKWAAGNLPRTDHTVTLNETVTIEEG